jgi:hypothetical protein
MKHALVVALVALSVPAFAADQVITVSFDSIAAIPSKSGEKLDPSLFSFGPAVPGGEDDTGHATSNAFGKSKDEACRWALLGTFLKFQAKAKAANKKVVGVRTYAGEKGESSSANCVCLAGGIVVRSTIKASYK